MALILPLNEKLTDNYNVDKLYVVYVKQRYEKES
jgi:hypothetical protein